VVIKDRLDQLLVRRKLASTIKMARAIIYAGEVYVDDRPADKPGLLLPIDITIRLKEKCRYVSRGGLKLEKAITHFCISVSDLICLDVGASTGGFTDCLLQHGAQKVHAVDVAYGQLAWKIRQDPKVVVLERFNARNITAEDIQKDPIQLAVMDVSFISLTTILPAIASLFSDNITILALIKPQFELPREDIGPRGVVEDPSLHKKAIDKIETFVHQSGMISRGIVPSPLLGPNGNREFLIHISSDQFS
jgi:23S rRNA (cytidine1920-2'-O)/16S rRNA (cytidine1409-2'-O)-methyltransferase